MSVSSLDLHEYVDANGGFGEVDKNNEWGAIAEALGVGTKKSAAAAIRALYLSNAPAQTWSGPLHDCEQEASSREPSFAVTAPVRAPNGADRRPKLSVDAAHQRRPAHDQACPTTLL